MLAAIVLNASAPGASAEALASSPPTGLGGQPGVVLRVGGDAVGLGLGGAAATGSAGAAFVHVQPAGLAALHRPEVTFTRLHLPADIRLEGLFYAQPIGAATSATSAAGRARARVGGGRWAIGAGFLRLNSGVMPETGSGGEQIGTFSHASGLVLLGAAYEPPLSAVRVGATGKALIEQFTLSSGTERGTGFGVDVGLTYDIRPTVQLAAVAQNVGGFSVGWTTGQVERADPTYHLGFSWNRREGATGGTGGRLTVVGEWVVPTRAWHAGVEYRVADSLMLRAGLDRGEPTVGFGVDVGTVRLDYAFLTRVPIGADPMDSGYVIGTHAFSVGVAF